MARFPHPKAVYGTQEHHADVTRRLRDLARETAHCADQRHLWRGSTAAMQQDAAHFVRAHPRRPERVLFEYAEKAPPLTAHALPAGAATTGANEGWNGGRHGKRCGNKPRRRPSRWKLTQAAAMTARRGLRRAVSCNVLWR